MDSSRPHSPTPRISRKSERAAGSRTNARKKLEQLLGKHTRKRKMDPRKLEDPTVAAEFAGLRYVSDEKLGITRRRAENGFDYFATNGQHLTDEQTLKRVRSLAIPPAWTDVWICPNPDGHIQATGRDARGRKQYRYHPQWRQTRDDTKFGKMVLFAKALPRIRERLERDLALPGLPRDKVLATVVRLLETTLIRVGNDEYARDNNSFGLTTMQDEHVDVNDRKVQFKFRGKSGKFHAITLHDKRLAGIVRRCRELPGYELFQYIDDDGKVVDVGSADVNAYLREISGEKFTAKDFRTWAGTVLAALALQEFETFDSKAQARKNVVRATEAVSERLGNTPSVCRKCYVHPAILESYLEGSLVETLKQRVEAEITGQIGSLRAEEGAVLAFLQKRLESEIAVAV